MIDRITRRSLIISLGVHAALLLSSFIAFGPFLPSLPPEPPTAPRPVPPAAAAPLAPAPAPLVRAEDRILATPARLSPLAPGDQPGAPIVRHQPTDRMAGTRTRGSGGEGDAPAALPAASPGSATTLAALQGRTRNVRLDQELVRLQTARTALELLARQRYRASWSAHSTRITRRDLLVWIELDARGRVERGGLFHCSTGVREVDAAIERWLNGGDGDRIGLPSLPAGATHYLELQLP